MAWSEKLPSGKYRGLYRDGLGKRRSAGTYTHKAEAKRKAAAAEEKAHRTIWRDPDAPKRTWGEWAQEWWPTRDVAPSTLKVDAIRRVKLDERWGSVQLGAITRQEIRTWAAELRAGDRSPQTVRRYVHLLSASLAAAVDAEILDVNPAARLKIEAGEVVHERYLTPADYAKLRAQMPTVRDQLILDTLAYTGLRWGEMAGLHAARFDAKSGVIRVAESWDELSGQMKGTPKGKRPRTVPLTPELVDQLAGVPHEGQTCGYDHDQGRCPGPLLLTTEGGSVLRNQKWAGSVFRPAVEAAEIGHVRIHDLRHTYASWLAQEGVDLSEIGKMLGHRNPTTTQRYAHLREEPSPAVLAALKGRK